MKLNLPKEDQAESPKSNQPSYPNQSNIGNKDGYNWLNALMKKLRVDKVKCKPMYFRGRVMQNTHPECRPYRHA